MWKPSGAEINWIIDLPKTTYWVIQHTETYNECQEQWEYGESVHYKQPGVRIVQYVYLNRAEWLRDIEIMTKKNLSYNAAEVRPISVQVDVSVIETP